jgi:glutathione transport system permease protein
VQIDTGSLKINLRIDDLLGDEGLAAAGFASPCHATNFSTEAHQSASKVRLPRVAAVLARFTRASFIEVIQEDFVRTARAKGLSERTVLAKHCLRNALIPVVTMMGLQFGFLLGGSIVVETVFNWPGLGRLLVDSVGMRDYPVIQTLVLLFSLEFILINLVVDLLYGFINPTIRYR